MAAIDRPQPWLLNGSNSHSAPDNVHVHVLTYSQYARIPPRATPIHVLLLTLDPSTNLLCSLNQTINPHRPYHISNPLVVTRISRHVIYMLPDYAPNGSALCCPSGIDTVASILIHLVLQPSSLLRLVGSTGGGDALILLLKPVLLRQDLAVLG